MLEGCSSLSPQQNDGRGQGCVVVVDLNNNLHGNLFLAPQPSLPETTASLF